MQSGSNEERPIDAPVGGASAFPATIPILVGGRWREGRGARVPLLDKFARVGVSQVSLPSREDVAEAVHAGAQAVLAGGPGSYERGEILRRAAELVRDRRRQFLEVMRVETGFTTADVEAEVSRCVETLRLCGEEARRFSGDIVPLEGGPGQGDRMGFTLRVPLGVVCAITPFNAPLNVLAHKVGPAIAAGNAVIAKPSLHTPFTANILGEVLLEAGLPPAFMSILHGAAETAAWLLAEPEVRFFAFTGSTEAGREIQKSIGLRRSQMELGSISHTIVDRGTDITRALPRLVTAGYRKAGQVCASIQVLLVHDSLYDGMVAALADAVAKLPYGAPSMPGCLVGPLISEAAAVRVDQWIGEAVTEGARRIVGGDRDGSVVPPTLLTNTTPEMKVRNREVFGPVVSVVPFSDYRQAIDAVNSTPFGLTAGVFTDSLANALFAAKTLRAGVVHVNETSSARADLMPFGGTKDSGFGREGPRHAILEMSEERLVTISA